MRSENAMTLVREPHFVGRDFTYFTYHAADDQPMSEAWGKSKACSLDATQVAVSQNSPAVFSINGVREWQPEMLLLLTLHSWWGSRELKS